MCAKPHTGAGAGARLGHYLEDAGAHVGVDRVPPGGEDGLENFHEILERHVQDALVLPRHAAMKAVVELLQVFMVELYHVGLGFALPHARVLAHHAGAII